MELKDSQGRKYANGAKFVYKKRLHRESLILYGGDDESKPEPLALCDRNPSMPHITIWATKPLIPGDHAHSSPKMETLTLEDGTTDVTAFYPWFRIFRGDKYASGYMCFVHILSDTPAMQTTFGGTRRDIDTDTETIRLNVAYEPLYRMEITVEKPEKGPSTTSNSMVASVKDYYHGEKVGVIKGFAGPPADGKDIEVAVGPGVDPAMMLCIAGCMKHLRP